MEEARTPGCRHSSTRERARETQSSSTRYFLMSPGLTLLASRNIHPQKQSQTIFRVSSPFLPEPTSLEAPPNYLHPTTSPQTVLITAPRFPIVCAVARRPSPRDTVRVGGRSTVRTSRRAMSFFVLFRLSISEDNFYQSTRLHSNDSARFLRSPVCNHCN